MDEKITGIGYCPTCTYSNCPTPTKKGKPGVNCSHWTDGKPMPEIDEHDTCDQCGSVITIDQGNYPLRCPYCEFELEVA